MPDAPNSNAIKHGCTSKTRILPGESEEEWNLLEQAWFDEYKPDNDNFLSLVRQAADAEWILNRNVRAYHDILHSIYTRQPEPQKWTEEDHHAIERFTRYKTTAERSFQRARNLVEQTRKNRQLEVHRREQLELAWAKERRLAEKRVAKSKREPEQFLPSPKIVLDKSPVIPAIMQYIDVEVENGKTISDIGPSNEEILQQSTTMDPPPQLIYRNINFQNEIIPPEYQWVESELAADGKAPCQKLPFDEWLAIIEREKGAEHIGPRNPDSPPDP